MAFETVVFVALLCVALLLGSCVALLLGICLTSAETPRAAEGRRPRPRRHLDHRGTAGNRLVPLLDRQRITTGRKHPADPLAHWACRALLLFNYRENERAEVTALPKAGRIDVCVGIRSLSWQGLWDFAAACHCYGEPGPPPAE